MLWPLRFAQGDTFEPSRPVRPVRHFLHLTPFSALPPLPAITVSHCPATRAALVHPVLLTPPDS
jgi:hypothetical protein